MLLSGQPKRRDLFTLRWAAVWALLAVGWGDQERALAEKPAGAPDYARIIDSETDWIADRQLASGAMASQQVLGAKGHHLNPYFGNLACLALLEKGAAHAAKVRKYMDWYLTHLNRPDHHGLFGTIYDYDVDPRTGLEASTKNYDSVDSYAATFLMLARKYHETTGDAAYLRDHVKDVEAIAEVMVKAIDPLENLALSKPDYPVKFLMDNAEVAKGLADAALVFRKALGDARKADSYGARAVDVKTAIHARMWGVDPERNGWHAARQGMTNQAHRWTTFYPDSVCQLYPLWTGTFPPTDEHVITAYNNFNTAWPRWQHGTFGDAFPWAVMGYAAALRGDRDRANAYLTWAGTRYLSVGHPPPWTILDAAFATLAAATLARK